MVMVGPASNSLDVRMNDTDSSVFLNGNDKYQ